MQINKKKLKNIYGISKPQASKYRHFIFQTF